MDVSAALAADLAALTRALDDPDIDLETGLRDLAADLKRAVSSYTGLSMTIALDGHDVIFTVDDEPTIRPVTSLLIPLTAAADAAHIPARTVGTLLLRAAAAGAFVDLSADLSYALGVDPATLVLDAHLTASVSRSAATGLDTHFAIDQAIGVLIGRGHTPHAARDELHRLAGLDHGGLRSAAETLIRSARTPPSGE